MRGCGPGGGCDTTDYSKPLDTTQGGFADLDRGLQFPSGRDANGNPVGSAYALNPPPMDVQYGAAGVAADGTRYVDQPYETTDIFAKTYGLDDAARVWAEEYNRNNGLTPLEGLDPLGE